MHVWFEGEMKQKDKNAILEKHRLRKIFEKTDPNWAKVFFKLKFKNNLLML